MKTTRFQLREASPIHSRSTIEKQSQKQKIKQRNAVGFSLESYKIYLAPSAHYFSELLQRGAFKRAPI